MQISMTRRELLKCGTVMGTSLLIDRRACGQSSEPRLETHTYKTVGDLAIKADVYRHQDKVTRPAAVWIHGGALIGGNKGDVPGRVKKHMLDAGYALDLARLSARTTKAASRNHPDLEDAFRWMRRRRSAEFNIDSRSDSGHR